MNKHHYYHHHHHNDDINLYTWYVSDSENILIRESEYQEELESYYLTREIAIMKLIGATDYFVRAPFVVEGVMIGLLGSALPLVLLYFLYSRVIAYIADKFSFLSNMMNFLPVGQVFHILIPVSLVLGVGIGFVGSRLTIRKHLKV